MAARKNDDIDDVLDRLRPLAEIYARDFIGRHVILEAEDIAFDVHWLNEVSSVPLPTVVAPLADGVQKLLRNADANLLKHTRQRRSPRR